MSGQPECQPGTFTITNSNDLQNISGKNISTRFKNLSEQITKEYESRISNKKFIDDPTENAELIKKIEKLTHSLTTKINNEATTSSQIVMEPYLTLIFELIDPKNKPIDEDKIYKLIKTVDALLNTKDEGKGVIISPAATAATKAAVGSAMAEAAETAAAKLEEGKAEAMAKAAETAAAKLEEVKAKAAETAAAKLEEVKAEAATAAATGAAEAADQKGPVKADQKGPVKAEVAKIEAREAAEAAKATKRKRPGVGAGPRAGRTRRKTSGGSGARPSGGGGRTVRMNPDLTRSDAFIKKPDLIRSDAFIKKPDLIRSDAFKRGSTVRAADRADAFKKNRRGGKNKNKTKRNGGQKGSKNKTKKSY